MKILAQFTIGQQPDFPEWLAEFHTGTTEGGTHIFTTDHRNFKTAGEGYTIQLMEDNTLRVE